jgi:hypothetical protein
VLSDGVGQHTLQYDDLETHFAPLADLGQVEWDALPEGTRFGLSYDGLKASTGLLRQSRLSGLGAVVSPPDWTLDHAPPARFGLVKSCGWTEQMRPRVG